MSYHSNRSKPQPISTYFIVIPLTMAALALCFACGLALYWPQMLNNQRLQGFAAGLYDYPLPAETNIVAQSDSVGLMGNSNHCDFMVTQTLVSNLSREDLESFYQDARISKVSDDSLSSQKGLVPIKVEFARQNSQDGTVHFTLTVIDAGYPAGLDIRCH